MRVHTFQPCLARSLFEHLIERVAGHWTTKPGQKDKPRAERLGTAQFAQTADLPATQRLHAVIRALGTPHPYPASVEINLRPLQTNKLADAQTMPVGHQDHRAI